MFDGVKVKASPPFVLTQVWEVATVNQSEMVTMASHQI